MEVGSTTTSVHCTLTTHKLARLRALKGIFDAAERQDEVPAIKNDDGAVAETLAMVIHIR